MTSERVERLLGAPELRRLVDALTRRVEWGRSLTGHITVTADAEERVAIAALFGQRPRPGTSTSVDLDRLDAIVRGSGVAASLAVAIEHLRGPIVVRQDQVEAVRRAWDAAHEALDSLVMSRPDLTYWATGLRARGALRRLSDTPADGTLLLRRVSLVLCALPADGEALPRLAARLLGSAHALDVGTPEATLVLSALSAVRGAQAADEGGRGARQRRELWASAGVAVDELSSTVLVHRLALPGPAGDLTRVGEPVILTLRQVHGLEFALPSAPVFVCENPSVVDAAARELGDAGRPLICIQGQPSLAADALLRRLAAVGLRYHGDFDWGGLRIANRLYELFDFQPWRYRSVDLEAYSSTPGAALKGTPVDARWDSDLRPALELRAVRLEEEQVLDVLLADLSVD